MGVDGVSRRTVQGRINRRAPPESAQTQVTGERVKERRVTWL